MCRGAVLLLVISGLLAAVPLRLAAQSRVSAWTLQDQEVEETEPQVEPGQPPTPEPAPRRREQRTEAPPRRSASELRALLASRRSDLASVPSMFGDVFANGGTVFIFDRNADALLDVPTAGGSRRVKIAEQNKAVPVDRVFFLYNHFHNALDAETTGGGLPRSYPVDRYTVGLEKTFCNRSWSAEIRMPFTGTYQFESVLGPDGFQIDGGKVGNLAVILKHVLWQWDDTVVSGGLGVDIPTGSDTTGVSFLTSYAVNNGSVHLLPYIGFLTAPTDSLFFHGFAQLDIAANGNTVSVETFDLTADVGNYTEQNLLYLDLSAGYWLYRNPCGCRLTGLAAQAELHYTSTLQDSDVVATAFPDTGGFFLLSNPDNRLDLLHATVGVHAELANRMFVRVGGVFPLRDQPDRVFDAEVQVVVGHRF